VATCLSGCPLGIDIPGFIRLLREGDIALSLERIKKENPFPAICGRICPAPCETACVFEADGNPISIRNLERFAADFGAKADKPIAAPKGKKVAIIGSGPAGMTAAYYLAKMNFSVTLFEAAHEPGGMLRYGVPEFRLPQKILDEQFVQLKALGIEIQTDAVFGRTLLIDELLMRGFVGILLATGASLPYFSELPGSSLTGVYYDTEFLNRVQALTKDDALDAARQQMIATPKTVVIGRGYAAFDAARLTLRLGSATQIVFDGFEEEAGVGEDILMEAKEEGLEVHSMKVQEIIGDANGYVSGVRCQKLDIVEAKEGLTLEASTEEPVILEAQTVIIANGHRSHEIFKQSSPPVFACGDMVTGAGSVVDAIASGKNVAQKIIQYLGQTP